MSHSMTCLSFEPEATPVPTAATAPTKCVWPSSVLEQLKPSAGSYLHIRTLMSREPVTTSPVASTPTARTSCSWPARVAQSWKWGLSCSIGTAIVRALANGGDFW